MFYMAAIIEDLTAIKHHPPPSPGVDRGKENHKRGEPNLNMLLINFREMSFYFFVA